jgi:SAM-dependent methyltransferase
MADIHAGLGVGASPSALNVGQFAKLHAQVYDTIYAAKDYAGECDALEALFSRWGKGPIRRVLDIGCGTGGHALVLAKRGYQVTGLDRSPAMLARAQQKAEQAGVEIEFVNGDGEEAAKVMSGRSFDAVVMCFTTLGYFVEEGSLLKLFAAVKELLRPGGVFVADYWYGPAVLRSGPSTTVRPYELSDRSSLLRIAAGGVDILRQHYHIELRFLHWRDHDFLHDETEHHTLRFFFPGELRVLCATAGLELMALTAFSDVKATPSTEDWWSALVARHPTGT